MRNFLELDSEWLCALAIIIAGIWYYLVANYNYWKELGIPGPEPKIFFGNMKDAILSRCSLPDVFRNIAREFPDAPIIGIYQFRTPLLVLRDPELIKDVLIKDFSSFSDRGIPLHEKVEPLEAHLFHLESKRWRVLRPKLSPAFTSGKIKHMFTLMMECAEYFEKYIDTLADQGEIVDCVEVAAKFTTDVIGNCAFGIHMNAIADEASEFRRIGRRIFFIDFKVKLLVLLRSAAPWLYDLLGIPAMHTDVTEFIVTVTKQTIEYRRKNNVRRGDLIDILLDLKSDLQSPDLALTDSLIAAQAFVFFIAGFDTSATTISHALLELAQRQDVQDKLRREILDSLQGNNDGIAYDTVKKMKYLHMVFQETLRLRPPVPVHFRKASKDYTFEGTNITIQEGQSVWIPVSEIQLDPKHYPNPELFEPERFTEDMIRSRHPMTYTPFGDGPRNCIGARFAIYQTKLGLIKILTKYKVEVPHQAQIPYKHMPGVFLRQRDGGIHLKWTKIDGSL